MSPGVSNRILSLEEEKTLLYTKRVNSPLPNESLALSPALPYLKFCKIYFDPPALAPPHLITHLPYPVKLPPYPAPLPPLAKYAPAAIIKVCNNAPILDGILQIKQKYPISPK